MMMTRYFFYFFLLYFSIIYSVFGNEVFELRFRLNQIHSFYAKFVQKISDSKDSIFQESQGELWVQHPNLFNFHTILPEENFLISNGETLWFYDVCINQVTISCLKDIINETGFILFAGDLNSELDKYHINQKGDVFCLKIKEDESNILKKIIITITRKGIIKDVNIIDRYDQCIHYQLLDHVINSVSMDKFIFLLPHDVAIDEQR